MKLNLFFKYRTKKKNFKSTKLWTELMKILQISIIRNFNQDISINYK